MSDDFFSECDFTLAELREYLGEVRNFCNKSDIEACMDLDSLFSRVLERNLSQSDLRDAESAVDYVKTRIKKLESDVRTLEVVPKNIRDLRDSIQQIGKYWQPSLRQKFETRISELRIRSEAAIEEAYSCVVPSHEKRLESLSFDLAAYADRPEVFQQVTQRFLGQLRDDFDDALMHRFPGEYERLQVRVEEIARECMQEYHRRALDEALEGTYQSIASTTRLLRALRSADRFFGENQKNDNALKEQFRTAFENIAWARSRKLLSEAELFGASGNGKRSRTLYTQAQIALSQDWPKVFGKEPLPDLPALRTIQSIDASGLNLSS